MKQITSVTSHNTETCKAITIDIAGHLLALPVTAVFKVIRSSFVYSSNFGENKLIHIEEQTLPLIDLHPLLSTIKPNNEPEQYFNLTSEEETFLVLAKSDTSKLVAIVVDEPPSLMDLPLSQIYALPPSQQQNIGNIASHIAIVPHQASHLTGRTSIAFQERGQPLTVMLLDIQQALITTGFASDVTAYSPS